MTFDELQLIVQSIAIAQRESQAMQQETQLLVQSIDRSWRWGKGKIRAKFIMGTNFCNDMTLSRQADNHKIIT